MAPVPSPQLRLSPLGPAVLLCRVSYSYIEACSWSATTAKINGMFTPTFRKMTRSITNISDQRVTESFWKTSCFKVNQRILLQASIKIGRFKLNGRSRLPAATHFLSWKYRYSQYHLLKNHALRLAKIIALAEIINRLLAIFQIKFFSSNCNTFHWFYKKLSYFVLR